MYLCYPFKCELFDYYPISTKKIAALQWNYRGLVCLKIDENNMLNLLTPCHNDVA